ncbi:hypothetical protein [Vibrio sp. HENC-03]|uniref:hypothetical protein n=1 Tax=Vibrio sp. HENC-03 TaxID=992012 RepID=UPI0005196330|nr:hypothetical protein [Vibrio sp. HENC-03]
MKCETPPISLLFLKCISDASLKTSKGAFVVLFVWFFLVHWIFYAHFNNPVWLTAAGTMLVILSLMMAFTNLVVPDIADDIKPMCAEKSKGIYICKDNPTWEINDIEVVNAGNKQHYAKMSDKYSRIAIYYVFTLIGSIVASYGGLIT